MTIWSGLKGTTRFRNDNGLVWLALTMWDLNLSTGNRLQPQIYHIIKGVKYT
jgi:hypothetical protein